MSRPSPVPPPDLPAGFSARGMRRDDADTAHALVVAHHGATGGSEPPPLSEVVADLEYPDLDLDRDAVLVHDASGGAVLYAIGSMQPSGRTFFDVFIDPELDRVTRVALGVAIAHWSIDRVLADARERGLSTTVAESGMLRGDTVLPDVMRAVDLEHARTWWRMSADTTALAAARPRVPDGVRFEKVDPDEDGAMRVAYLLEEETFADHYGNVPVPFDEFAKTFRNGAGYDRTAWWVAHDVESGAPVALLIGDDSRAADGAGFIDVLGVRSGHRGRGIAAALLLTAMADYRERGRTSVALSVDSINRTGAVALYEGVGMRPIDVIDTWERELPVS